MRREKPWLRTWAGAGHRYGMRKLVKPLLLLARLLVAAQLVLGLLVWSGMTNVTQLHVALGSLFVLDLWALGLIALFALPQRRLPLLTLLMGGVILWFGVAQRTLLVGSAHWAVRIAHLLLSIAALGLVEPLAKAVMQHHARTPAIGD